MEGVEQLIDACGQLLGAVVGRVTAGAGTGSAVTIHLAGRGGLCQAGFVIFIENASWRLDNGVQVLCSSRSSNLPGEEMVSGLAGVVGKELLSVELDRVSLDLVLAFSNELRLSVFADCMSDEYDGDNYSIFALSGVHTVGPRAALAFEARMTDQS